ncbi:subtilisin-like protein [Myriangium duriaei CBS 260.36]|uniref:Subtilisin-like protein n=1 Tax=Myriangium duriaei CBS 260.36 TaxID=1168546 RepID=A0A9P4J3Q1_9PEZI|nr:subtilisin-like protein [Myriangium duriaei CBS 260.36]
MDEKTLKRFICRDPKVAIVEHNFVVTPIKPGKPEDDEPQSISRRGLAPSRPSKPGGGSKPGRPSGPSRPLKPDRPSGPERPLRPGQPSEPRPNPDHSKPRPRPDQDLKDPMKPPRKPPTSENKIKRVRLKKQPWNVIMTAMSRPPNDRARTKKRSTRLVVDKAGSGVRVYVLDTGVFLESAGFKGRAVNFQGKTVSPYVRPPVSMKDDDGHGTHVSGIIADWNRGVAPWATIVNVKVLCSHAERRAGCYDQDDDGIIDALLDVTREHLAYQTAVKAGWKGNWRGSVINMSLGSKSSRFLVDALRIVKRAGIPIAAASGNDGAAVSPRGDWPCSQPESTCVASCGKSYTWSKFSNYGPEVKFIAPGNRIRSNSHKDANRREEMSGTSMAAPAVAGGMAIVIGHEGINSDPDKVVERLRKNGVPDVIKGVPRSVPNLLFDTGIRNRKRPKNEPYVK